MEIVKQWQEGKSDTWFAQKVQSLAWHYQVFEQLPVECRGGIRNAQTLLKDELIKKKILDYLQSAPTGKVTPKMLQMRSTQ